MPKALDSGRASDVTDTDWLFDFLLSVFKSPSWDLAVMGFIDENCAVFDKEEENKLSYTTLHHQFKELVSFKLQPRRRSASHSPNLKRTLDKSHTNSFIHRKSIDCF